MEYDPETAWIVAAGFVVSFILAFGIGANDVANSFGTSVGSRVLTLKSACFLATIFEISGSVLLGYKVSDTIRKGIIDVNEYKDTPDEYMLGNLAALGGSATWLIIATFLKMPISGTHSIVGAVLGFSLVARGFDGINWVTLGKIVGSWFVSPVLSGIVSGGIFFLIRKFILNRVNPIEPGLQSLPIFYGLTLFINVISILLDGPEMLKIQIGGLPAWSEIAFGTLIAVLIGLATALVVYLFIVPKLRREVAQDLKLARSSNPNSTTDRGDLVVFVIGNGNVTPDSSKDQTPINMSLDDFHQNQNGGLHNNIHTDINVNVSNGKVSNGYIDTNGYSTPAFTSLTEPIYEMNLKNDKHGKNNQRKNSRLEVIPMDGLSPNSSAVPLIKCSSTDVAMEVEASNGHSGNITGDMDDLDVETSNKDDKGDKPGVGRLFSFLQILTAAFGSFAHGGNDVSNAIGPLIALWLVYQDGSVQQKASTPIYLLVYGGIGISLGLWIWGRRVIKTMGEDLTKITPSSGFTIEIGAAVTVLVASKIGLPISTTHCKVGSVVFVGWIRSAKGGVDWKLFRNIVFAWLVTVPVSGGLSALLMWILKTAAM